MADRQVIINSQVYKLMPIGFCACGCGAKTKISDHSSKEKNWIKGVPRKFIGGHSNYHGGKTIDERGYLRVSNRNHPRADKFNGYIFEHILVAEKALGKPVELPHVVHHHTPDQLVVCEDQSYHILLHVRQRAYEACGHANWKRCYICKQYDFPENIINNKHRKCHSEAEAKRKSMKRREKKSLG